jgi:hypothetical protein
MTDAGDANPAVTRYVAVLVPSVVLSARVRGGDHLMVAAILGVALLAAYRFPVHLTDRTKVSVDMAVLIAAVLLLPQELAIATAAAAAAIHEFVDRVPWQQGVFNTAQTTLYVAAGAWVFRAIAGSGSPPLAAPGALSAALAAAAMHALNTSAVAGVAALQLGRPPLAFWLDGIWVDLPEHGALAATGVLAALAARSYPWVLPLLAGSLVLVYLSLRTRAELRAATRATADAIADLSDRHGSPSGATGPGHGGQARSVPDLAGPALDTNTGGAAANVVRESAGVAD